MAAELRKRQEEICRKYDLPWTPAPDHLKVGVADNVRSGLRPFNGLRHPPEGDTTGWYIWAGAEPSQDPDFFKSLHVRHLTEWCPDVLPYLGLPPGSRFLIAPNHEDVWEDESLLNV
jgi:hypothetical protein